MGMEAPPGYGAGSTHVILTANALVAAPSVALIFWGSYWSAVPSTNPDPSAIIAALTTLIKTGYFSALSEYGVGPFQQPVQWTSVTADPPANYGDADIRKVVVSAARSGAISSPPESTIYCVITGGGTPAPSGYSNDAGYHSTLADGGQTLPYAWVSGQQLPHATNVTLTQITVVLTHELVEAATFGYRDPTKPLGEIGDVCGDFSAAVGGVDVSPYWSETQNLCVTGGVQVRQKHSGFAFQNSWQNAWGMPGNFEVFVAPQNGPGMWRFTRYNHPQPNWLWEIVRADSTFAAPSAFQTRHGLLAFCVPSSGSQPQMETFFRQGEAWWGAEFVPDRQVHLDLRTDPGLAGRPAVIQSDVGGYGNYEVVAVLTDGSINHYTRDNGVDYTWSDARPVGIPAIKGDARVALMQASFQSSLDSNGGEVRSRGAPGSFHVVVQTGGQLYHAVYTGGEWVADTVVVRPPHQKPRRVLSPISVNGQTVTNCVGTPGLIETRQGRQRRNFQLVVAKADGSVEHYTRDNDVAPFIWQLVRTFAAGDAVAEISLFQSTLPGAPLEVIAITQGGRAILHYQGTGKVSPLGVAENWVKEVVFSKEAQLWKI